MFGLAEDEESGHDIHQWLGWLLGGAEGSVIQIALDGSASLSGYYSYAGIVGSQGDWVALSRLWEAKLKRHDIPYLRMTEAMGFHQSFLKKRDEWGADATKRRDDLLMEFALLGRDLNFRTTGFAVHALGLADDKLVLRKRELFQEVVHDIVDGARRAEMKGSLALMCDTEQDAADYFRKWLNHLQQRDEMSRRIAVLCFANSRVVTPLQLADMTAYLLREEAERGEMTPDAPANPLLSILVDPSMVTSGRRWKGSNLIDGLGDE